MKNYELRITNYELRIVKIFCVLCVLCGSFFSVGAQSTSQSYPTAISSNEISGKIVARDIGDSRLTDYFYVFSGHQGDVFVNVQTSNFNGDIDIFTAGDLKPLTKITIYADDTNRETGRVVYLRQPAKLILRVEGRSPNDDAATFTIKFAGSFEPVQAAAENSAPEMPEVKSENQSDVRVNSVGTIIEVKPKPSPQPKEIIAKKEVKPRRKKSEDAVKEKQNTRETETADEGKNIKSETGEVKEQSAGEKTAPVVVAADNSAAQKTSKADEEISPENAEEKPIEKTTETSKTNVSEKKAKTAVASKPKNKPAKIKQPNPLENVHLIILLKDGTRIERAMSEVVRFAVVRGILTIVSTDGSTGRYSILDVAKMTIE